MGLGSPIWIDWVACKSQRHLTLRHQHWEYGVLYHAHFFFFLNMGF